MCSEIPGIFSFFLFFLKKDRAAEFKNNPFTHLPSFFKKFGCLKPEKAEKNDKTGRKLSIYPSGGSRGAAQSSKPGRSS